MADGGEWKCFHDINHESQRALAEMNETLGSLRQWQKQREAGPLLLAAGSVEEAPATEQLISGMTTTTSRESSSDSKGMVMGDCRRSGDKNWDAGGEDLHQSIEDEAVMGAEQEDPLLVLWKVQLWLVTCLLACISNMPFDYEQKVGATICTVSYHISPSGLQPIILIDGANALPSTSLGNNKLLRINTRSSPWYISFFSLSCCRRSITLGHSRLSGGSRSSWTVTLPSHL